MKVTKIIATDIATCSPDATLQEVDRSMLELGVGSIPVSDDEKLHVIITERDIVTRGMAAQFVLKTPVS